MTNTAHDLTPQNGARTSGRHSQIRQLRPRRGFEASRVQSAEIALRDTTWIERLPVVWEDNAA